MLVVWQTDDLCPVRISTPKARQDIVKVNNWAGRSHIKPYRAGWAKPSSLLEPYQEGGTAVDFEDAGLLAC